MSRSHDQHLERLLSGAIFEYLDRGMIDELEADMAYVLNQEINLLQQKIKAFQSAKRRLLSTKSHLLVVENE